MGTSISLGAVTAGNANRAMTGGMKKDVFPTSAKAVKKVCGAFRSTVTTASVDTCARLGSMS